MDRVGPEEVHRMLTDKDPGTAAALGLTDRQRLTRAWEVLIETGRPLIDWQRDPPEGGLDGPILRAVVEVPREDLYHRIDTRFEAMLDGGGLEEVAAFLETQPPNEAPARRAVGVQEMADFLSGASDRAQAIAAGQQATRRLAKRQMTWFRNQITNWPRIEQDSKTSLNEFFAKIRA
jgi:tRNA dimethylallyltransferase